jgi:hypothetical protein
MKKNVKAIIAALSASIMCAVPVAASFASTAATTSITAEAAGVTSPQPGDNVAELSQPYGISGNRGVALNAVVYEVNTSTGEAAVCGRYSHIRSIESADWVKLKGRTYKVTSVKDDAFATTTQGTYTVNKFIGGKYLTRVGARAFKGTLVYTIEFKATEHIYIGDSAFMNANFRVLNLPADITCGPHAFEGNYSLTTVNVKWTHNNNYNKPVTLESRAFANCTSLVRFASDNRRMLYLHRDSFYGSPNPNFAGGQNYIIFDAFFLSYLD